jgi:hypothetical protein
MNKDNKILLLKIIIQLITFSLLSIIVWFTWFWTMFLSISIFIFIWPLWWFNLIELITNIKINKKYRLIFSSTLAIGFISLIVIITCGGAVFDYAQLIITFGEEPFDYEDIEISELIIYSIILVVSIITLILCIKKFIINLIKILKEYLPELKNKIIDIIKKHN